jgi:hypothetical protein
MAAPARHGLMLGAIYPEPHCPVRRAPIKIILEFDGDLLCHPGLPAAPGLPACLATQQPGQYLGTGRGWQRSRPQGGSVGIRLGGACRLRVRAQRGATTIHGQDRAVDETA